MINRILWRAMSFVGPHTTLHVHIVASVTASALSFPFGYAITRTIFDSMAFLPGCLAVGSPDSEALQWVHSRGRGCLQDKFNLLMCTMRIELADLNLAEISHPGV